ncbi:amidase [Rhodococcus olei]|uniref:Amidase n=1 Tax=Rhodococcus olei TaxID=2161675 RepID=A0ABP8NXZ7_9NOCA
MTRLSRRSLFAVGAAAGASLLAGCGGGTPEPEIPPLPGGGTTAGATPAERAVWRLTGSPLVPPTGSGDLDGLTVAVSDLFAVAGQQIGAGNPTWLGQAPRESTTAAALTRLLGAGAALRGLTQTDDLGYGHSGVNDHYGTPPNPAAEQQLPGGSTSGAAAAVAGGDATAAIGSDTGASVRIPAAYQGLCAFTPTRGAVSTAGLLPLSPTLDTVGWLAGDIATLARVATASVPKAAARRLDRAVTSPGVNAVASADVHAAMTTALAGWKGTGLPALTEQDLDIAALPDWYDAVTTVIGHEAWKQFGTFVSQAPAAVGGEARDNLAAAGRVTESAYTRARTTLDDAAAAVTEYLGERVLVLPTTATTAPSRTNGGTASDDYRNALRSTGLLTSIATVAGLPTVTMRLKSATPAPVGLCLVAPAGRDLDLLEVARQVQGSGLVR